MRVFVTVFVRRPICASVCVPTGISVYVYVLMYFCVGML